MGVSLFFLLQLQHLVVLTAKTFAEAGVVVVMVMIVFRALVLVAPRLIRSTLTCVSKRLW